MTFSCLYMYQGVSWASIFQILLNEFGFNPQLIDPLRTDYLSSLSAILYPSWGGHSLDSHKTFTVTYEPEADRDLSCHFDNAEVTLNVALTRDFSGGDLYFYNMHGQERTEDSTVPLRLVAPS